jgi:hypothetical protein
MTNCLKYLVVVCSFFLKFHTIAQNHSYTIIYEQVYPMVRDGEYLAGRNLFDELHTMYTVDPSERSQFAFVALQNGDVDYFKSTYADLIRNYGYFFTYADTLKLGTIAYYARDYDLVDWLVDQTNTGYPKWVAENPTGFFIQQRILQLDEKSSTRTYFLRMLENDSITSDSVLVEEALKYLRDLDFNLLYEIITLCRSHGLPNNFDSGGKTYVLLQRILSNNAMDQFNFERTWHHIFPFLETAYFAGKISSSFLKLYDRALEEHYRYQYYGTLDSVEVKDPAGLSERRKKYHL